MSDEIFHTPVDRSETGFVDVSSQVKGWLHSTLALALAYNIPTVTSELRALTLRRKLPGFRLTVVGEPTRGKSTLLNHLLGRYLLRARAYPTTATITSIVAGEREQMEIHFPDGHHELRHAGIASWNDLVCQRQPDKLQTIFPHVYITLEHPWLREVDLELMDTPGVGTFNDSRAVLFSEILSQSDAAILVVNAAAALSITETAFLEQEVIGRHVPRIMVVVTKLDTIPPEEEEAVLEVVREKVARVSPLIQVFPSSLTSEGAADVGKIEAIRAQIERLAAKSERRTLRSRQVAEALLDSLHQMIEVGQTAIAVAQMNAAKRREILREQEEEGQLTQRRWGEIELHLNERRLLLDEELRQRLRETRHGLVATISLELSKTQNLKGWWEKDLPQLLRRDFLNLARTEESYILGTVASDLRWLCEEVADVFGVRMDNKLRYRRTLTKLEPEVKSIKLTDVERLRLLSRVGSGAAMIANYMLFFNPIGAAVGGAISVAVGLINEYTLNKRVDEQREQLRNEAVRSIDQAVDEYDRLLSAHLLSIYKEMAQNLQRMQSTLQTEKKMILKQDTLVEDDKSWEKLIDQASALQQEIMATL